MSLKVTAARYTGIAHGIDKLTSRLNAAHRREAAPARVRSGVSDQLSAGDKGWFYHSTLLRLGR